MHSLAVHADTGYARQALRLAQGRAVQGELNYADMARRMQMAKGEAE